MSDWHFILFIFCTLSFLGKPISINIKRWEFHLLLFLSSFQGLGLIYLLRSHTYNFIDWGKLISLKSSSLKSIGLQCIFESQLSWGDKSLLKSSFLFNFTILHIDPDFFSRRFNNSDPIFNVGNQLIDNFVNCYVVFAFGIRRRRQTVVWAFWSLRLTEIWKLLWLKALWWN